MKPPACGGQVQSEATGKVRYVQVVAFDERELPRRFSDAACVALDTHTPGWRR